MNEIPDQRPRKGATTKIYAKPPNRNTHTPYSSNNSPITYDQSPALQLQAERALEQREVAAIAAGRYKAGSFPRRHPYLVKKNLEGPHRTRLDERTGALMLPMWVKGSGIVNLQFIYTHGDKHFIDGGRVDGTYGVIGSLLNPTTIHITSGFAKGAKLYELYDQPAVLTFCPHNLMPIAAEIRKNFPCKRIVIASDSDRFSYINLGRRMNSETTNQIGASVVSINLLRYLCGRAMS